MESDSLDIATFGPFSLLSPQRSIFSLYPHLLTYPSYKPYEPSTYYPVGNESPFWVPGEAQRRALEMERSVCLKEMFLLKHTEKELAAASPACQTKEASMATQAPP